MRIPGFTAEASLYRTPRRYYLAAQAQPGSGAISPALRGSLVQPAACDYECYAAVQDECIPYCLEMVGNSKGLCLRNCARFASQACGCNFFR